MSRAMAWFMAAVATLLMFASEAGVDGANINAAYFAALACFWHLVADREERKNGGAR